MIEFLSTIITIIIFVSIPYYPFIVCYIKWAKTKKEVIICLLPLGCLVAFIIRKYNEVD